MSDCAHCPHVPQLVAALKAQHHAIDILFAMLIDSQRQDDPPFYPSKSGQPWKALLAGKAALESVGEKP